MKRALAIALGVVAALAVVLGYNVWRGETEVQAPQPGPVEQGRQALHAQLEKAAAREAQIEKTYWDQPEKLQVLIQSHQTRIAELEGNPAGGEIVAHDKEAIARLQNRITAIAAERQAAAAEAAAQAAAAQQAAGTAPSNP
ncbi:MAG: hypothetical protein P4L40_18070 [Terracidiphilus sp.]|nr:hypothetical protein [Terracidiphilus sp.]